MKKQKRKPIPTRGMNDKRIRRYIILCYNEVTNTWSAMRKSSITFKWKYDSNVVTVLPGHRYDHSGKVSSPMHYIDRALSECKKQYPTYKFMISRAHSKHCPIKLDIASAKRQNIFNEMYYILK